MKLASYSHGSRPIVGVVLPEGVGDLTGYVGSGDHSPMRRLLTGFGSALTTLKIDDLPVIPFEELTPAPLIADPSKIVAAPVNYSDHQKEMRESSNVESLGVFLKAPSSVLAAGGTVVLPYSDRRFDQEGELAVVIGRSLRNASEQEALEGIAGYTGLLDITMRGGEDRSTRKSFETFTPIGPHLVTADEVGDIESLRLLCSVNGVVRQDAEVRELIWGVAKLVSYVSSVMSLFPGDIVTTGTPAGVGEISHGDEIELRIDRLGTLTATVSNANATTSPTTGASKGPTPPSDVTPVRARTSTGEYVAASEPPPVS